MFSQCFVRIPRYLFLLIDVFPLHLGAIGPLGTASSIIRVPVAYRRRSDPPKPIVRECADDSRKRLISHSLELYLGYSRSAKSKLTRVSLA
jgi:hypothetical protein